MTYEHKVYKLLLEINYSIFKNKGCKYLHLKLFYLKFLIVYETNYLKC